MENLPVRVYESKLPTGRVQKRFILEPAEKLGDWHVEKGLSCSRLDLGIEEWLELVAGARGFIRLHDYVDSCHV